MKNIIKPDYDRLASIFALPVLTEQTSFLLIEMNFGYIVMMAAPVFTKKRVTHALKREICRAVV
ncbi:hypothetical protein MAR_033492 [Mya arenaria]|uniref:Uncharacterized protein n=1 Tax=Mya arenaria TaxID=6604 RepID=A0ABY7G965_MYAAR|nr:hypothetical protein MAR_033492 [Mya arenaria]